MISILLIEDEQSVAFALKVQLESTFTFKVENAVTLMEGILLVSERHFDAVLLDLNLPDSKGSTTLKRFQKYFPNLPCIVVSGYISENPILFGAQDFIIKGYQPYEVMEHMILNSIERHKVRQLFTPLNEEIQGAKQLVEELKGLHNK